MEQVSTPNRAGIFQGEQHSETGIPLALIDTGSRIEVEGGEFNFPEWVQTDKKIHTLSGKNLDVIKQIFEIIGAHWDEKVTHVKSGDIIICIRSAFDDEVRTYTGTLIQIISAVNESRGCKHVQSGATMTNHETGATKKMLAGGTIRYQETIDDSDYKFIKDINDIKIGKRYLLDEIISHEKLFKTFPDFKKIIVIFEEIKYNEIEAFAETTFDVNTKIIIGLHLSYYKKYNHEKYELRKTDYPERSKEGVLLHEIQHACQFKNRREIGRSYHQTLIATCERNSCDNESDAIKKGLWLKVQEEAEVAYKIQPPEQEAMWVVDVWLKKIGLNYGNRQYFLFDDKFKDLQSGSQEGIYSGGGSSRVKHSAKAYRNIDGILYSQWTDGVESKERVQQIIDEEQKTFPNHTFVFRKMNDGYRVYRSAEITPNSQLPTPNSKNGGQLPELNDKGGYEYKDKDEKVAERCGLITLPKSIAGTNCSNCFPANAKIFTKDGEKNISDVKKGDLVFGYKNGEIILNKVIEVGSRKAKREEMIKIGFGKKGAVPLIKTAFIQQKNIHSLYVRKDNKVDMWRQKI